MRSYYISLCLSMMLISSCAPSPEIVATAMAQTQVALSFTKPQLPTASLISMSEHPTVTPTEVQKPVPTITSTPDLRVIKSDPMVYLCDSQDFPGEGDYFLPAPDAIFTYLDSNGKKQTFYMEHLNHISNDILIIDKQSNSSYAVQSYIAETGRVDGWKIEFNKGKSNFDGPYTVICNVESYETSEGAILAVQKFNQAETSEVVGWEYDEGSHPSLGSADVFLKNEDLKKQDLANHVALQFSYRNYRVTINALDKTQKEIAFDILYHIGLNTLRA